MWCSIWSVFCSHIQTEVVYWFKCHVSCWLTTLCTLIFFVYTNQLVFSSCMSWSNNCTTFHSVSCKYAITNIMFIPARYISAFDSFFTHHLWTEWMQLWFMAEIMIWLHYKSCNCFKQGNRFCTKRRWVSRISSCQLLTISLLEIFNSTYLVFKFSSNSIWSYASFALFCALFLQISFRSMLHFKNGWLFSITNIDS